MEDEDRREMVHAVSELAARFGAAVSLNPNMFSLNPNPPHGSQARSRMSTVAKSARTDQRKGKRPSHAQQSGPMIAGEFNQISERLRQGDFISGVEIQGAQRPVNFVGEKMT